VELFLRRSQPGVELDLCLGWTCFCADLDLDGVSILAWGGVSELDWICVRIISVIFCVEIVELGLCVVLLCGFGFVWV
jgi:hypothetical protein